MGLKDVLGEGNGGGGEVDEVVAFEAETLGDLGCCPESPYSDSPDHLGLINRSQIHNSSCCIVSNRTATYGPR